MLLDFDIVLGGMLSGKLSLANEGQYLLIGTASLRLLLSQMRMRFENGDHTDEDQCMSE